MKRIGTFSVKFYGEDIVAIADGVIAECGTHEELLKTDGIYSQLYKTQNALALEAMR